MSEPRVELLTIGREILDGRIVDTNSVKIAEMLRTRGLVPRWAQRVDDELGRIVEAFRIVASRSDVILVTGGLGPTSDDLTAEAFGKFLGEPMVMNEEALAGIEAYLARFSRKIIEAQKKQALLPASCFILPNPEGTAPGFGLERDGKAWYFLPGVPREMLRMLREQVLPRLPSREGYRTRSWITHFTAESVLQQRLAPVEALLKPDFEITYQTRFPENHVGLIGDCADDGVVARYEAVSARITEILGADVFWVASRPDEMKSLEQVVVPELAARGRRVRVVEQVTGGELAARITAVAGSERVFESGWVRGLPAGTNLTAEAGALGNAAEGSVGRATGSAVDGPVRQSAVSSGSTDRSSSGKLSDPPSGAAAVRVGAELAQAWALEARGANDRIAGYSGVQKSASGVKDADSVGVAIVGDAASFVGWVAVAGEQGVVWEEVKPRIAVELARFRVLLTQKALDLLRRWDQPR